MEAIHRLTRTLRRPKNTDQSNSLRSLSKSEVLEGRRQRFRVHFHPGSTQIIILPRLHFR